MHSCRLKLFILVKMIYQIFVFLMVTVDMVNADASSANSNTNDYMAKLKKDLFGNSRIDNKKRPVLNYADPVNVDFMFVILHIYKMDERTGTLIVNGWLEVSWVDQQLKWDPSNYDGLSYIEMSDLHVWKPDITILNSAKDPWEYNTVTLYINNEGHVFWLPLFVSSTSCVIDHKYFPFDEHMCNIDIGSWMYDNRSLVLHNSYPRHPDEDTVSKMRVENPLWKITDAWTESASLVFECCPDAIYPFVQHKLRISRSSPLYKYLLIIPSIMSVILTLSLFWTPPSAGEKITLGGISVVIQLGLLIALGFIVPPGGISVPHIVLFVGNSFVMSCLALSVSILVIRLSRGHSYTPLPSLIKNILQGPFGKILCFGPASHQADTTLLNEDKPESESAEGNNSEREIASTNFNPSTFGDWILLATAIDHFCFIIYCIIFTLILISSFT